MRTDSMIPARSALAGLMIALAGCAAQVDDVATRGAELEGVDATVTFTADWQTRQEGTLRAGSALRIVYAPERARCTLSRGGSPLWSVQAHYRVDGGEVHTVHVAGHSPSPDSANPPIELTQAGELEVWFENTDAGGCQFWDSAYGANYRFAIEAAAGESPVARFDAAYRTTIEGDVVQGRSLRIVYDASRLTSCRATRYGNQAWSILAHYRFASGRTGYVPLFVSGAAQDASLELSEGGELSLWFENQDANGCRQWDSAFGSNYRISVDSNDRAPGWMGRAAWVINRATCDAGPCDANRQSLDTSAFNYDTYGRQRAAIAALYFDVWKAGVTDFDNAELWRQLDVQVHYRFRSDAPFTARYATFSRRVGNDARYEVSLRSLDPLGGYTRTSVEQCPDAPLTVSGPLGEYVRTEIELYFTVNGAVLRRADGSNFRGSFEDYRGLFEVCPIAE